MFKKHWHLWCKHTGEFKPTSGISNLKNNTNFQTQPSSKRGRKSVPKNLVHEFIFPTMYHGELLFSRDWHALLSVITSFDHDVTSTKHVHTLNLHKTVKIGNAKLRKIFFTTEFRFPLVYNLFGFRHNSTEYKETISLN